MKKSFKKYYDNPMASLRELSNSEKIFKCDDCERFKYHSERANGYAEFICAQCARSREVKTLAKEK